MVNKELLKHRHICLIEDHYNPLGIVRSLGEVGIEPIILLTTKSPRMVNKSKYAKNVYLFEDTHKAFEYMVKTYGNEVYKPFVYNGSDKTALILDEHYKELKDKFYFSNGRGGLKKYLNKYDITVLAEECGCDIPQEELVLRGQLPHNLRYPVITKAESSTILHWKEDSFICDTPEQLKEAFSHIRSEKVLIQEFIKKENEYCIDGISINGGDEIFMPYAASYYRFSEKSYGAYMYFRPVLDESLIAKIKNIIRGASYSGIFCIEFLIGSDGKYYFLEVNFRNSGWSYAFTYGGYNLLYNWAISTLNNHIDAERFKPINQFTAMSEFEDYQMFVKSGELKLVDWVKDFKNSDCTFIYNKKDPKPFYSIMLGKVRRKLFRKQRQ